MECVVGWVRRGLAVQQGEQEQQGEMEGAQAGPEEGCIAQGLLTPCVSGWRCDAAIRAKGKPRDLEGTRFSAYICYIISL